MNLFRSSFVQSLALGLFALSLTSCSTSNARQFSPTAPASIKLLPEGVSPACEDYTTLGTVSASTLNEMGVQRSEDSLNNALRLQAAGMGATRVIDIETDDDQMMGTAIHCTEN